MEFFNEEKPFILIIQAHWLNVQLCPMKNLFLTHFSPSKPLSKSVSVNFDFILGDMRHTYFNVYILPLGHLGIVKKTFLVTDILKGTFCFYLVCQCIISLLWHDMSSLVFYVIISHLRRASVFFVRERS